MIRRWLGIALAALLLTVACGGEESQRMPNEYHKNIQKAVAYLEGSYREGVGLLYESPGDGVQAVDGTSWQLNQVHWTQTDNLLAALALQPYNRMLSESIRTTIDRYRVSSASKPNVIAVLDGEVVSEGVKAARTIVEAVEEDDYIVLTEVQDGNDIPDWSAYGNLLALQSLNQWLRGNERRALRLYHALLGMWDEHGINDKAARADNQYAVYKIALVLLLSKVYEDDLLEATDMERVMWSAQEGTGGIRTDIDARTYAIGGYTNTETTSLVLLVYDGELIQSLRSAGPQAQKKAAWGTSQDLHPLR